MTSGTGPWPRLPGACHGHGVQGPAKQSFAPPSLGEQSPQASPSVLGRAGGAQHKRRRCQCCLFPANSRLFFHLSPAPCTSSPYATVTSRSLHCPPCQPPTWGTPGTGRGSRGQCWKKRRPAEPGVRCCSCQGLSLTHLTLFLLCPHQRDLAQAWGGGAPGG